MKYINFRIFQSHLGFSIDQEENILELVNELLPYGKFIKVDTPFSTEYEYKE